MVRRYFDLYDDVYIPGRWELGAPTDQHGREIDDPWQFADGRPVSVEGGLKLPIKRPGQPLDFSLAGRDPARHAQPRWNTRKYWSGRKSCVWA